MVVTAIAPRARPHAPRARPRGWDGHPGREAALVGRAIESAVQSLSPPLRAAFMLRELHGFEYGEIAEALGVDLGTVKSRLSRARARLREALGGES